LVTFAVLTALFSFSPHVSAAVARGDGYGGALQRVQQAVAERDFRRAEEVLARLLASYGENAELLTVRGRVLFWQKRYADALATLERARQLQPSRELDAEMRQVETARLLSEADDLVDRGALLPAGALLSRGFREGCDRYQTGMRLASVRNRQGRHREAAELYRLLIREYPEDAGLPLLFARAVSDAGDKAGALQVLEPLLGQGPDPQLHALRGRILFEEGRYLEAREEYETAKRLGGTPDLAARRKEVEEAISFGHARALVAGGGYDLALPLLKAMSAAGAYSREARLLSGQVLLAQRRFGAALTHGGLLYHAYPHDPEAVALYAESLEETGQGAEAERVLYGLDGAAGERLRGEREDLFYRAKGNWLRLAGEAFGYSDRSGTESGVGVTVSQRFSRVRGVASLAEITRFGLTDPRVALDLYVPEGEESTVSGALYLSTAPGSHFLPRYTAGAEMGYRFSSVELFGGYDRVGFREDPANVLTAALLWESSAVPVSLEEKFYVAAGRGSVLSVTTVNWDPSHRCRLFFSGGVGSASERRIASEDLDRHDTWLVRAGGEYRITPSYSIGAEGSVESRHTLYDRYGGVLYLRYWWP